LFRTEGFRSKQLSRGQHNLCVLNDSAILSLIKERDLIRPFEPKLISCGGVDLRLANEYYMIKCVDKVFDTHKRNSLRRYYHKSRNPSLLINPSERFLVCSLEEFNMPSKM
jgi:deoxycytidine triphosphate deaminase